METSLLRVEAIRCWNGQRARTLVTGSFLGALVVTTQRLLFISCGVSGISWRCKTLVRGFIEGFPQVFVRVGWSRTKDLQPDHVRKEGSFEVPLQRILVCEAARRWDHSPYLRLSFLSEDGKTTGKVLMTEGGLDMQEIKDIEAAVAEAKKQSRCSADRSGERGPAPASFSLSARRIEDSQVNNRKVAWWAVPKLPRGTQVKPIALLAFWLGGHVLLFLCLTWWGWIMKFGSQTRLGSMLKTSIADSTFLAVTILVLSSGILGWAALLTYCRLANWCLARWCRKPRED
ncbi:MAG TPA: hypothetical protein VL171_15715 [Verrucomicrobiae bacterium]|nr:hypothetical protein [Verrucomicrobiae bacterium]